MLNVTADVNSTFISNLVETIQQQQESGSLVPGLLDDIHQFSIPDFPVIVVQNLTLDVFLYGAGLALQFMEWDVDGWDVMRCKLVGQAKQCDRLADAAYPFYHQMIPVRLVPAFFHDVLHAFQLVV